MDIADIKRKHAQETLQMTITCGITNDTICDFCLKVGSIALDCLENEQEEADS